MCSGTWCMSLVWKLHYLLFHEITFQGEETMTAAGISCWWCFKLSFCTMSVKDFDQFFLSEHLDISIQFSCPVMNATVSSSFKILQIFFFCWKLLHYTISQFTLLSSLQFPCSLLKLVMYRSNPSKVYCKCEFEIANYTIEWMTTYCTGQV